MKNFNFNRFAEKTYKNYLTFVMCKVKNDEDVANQILNDSLVKFHSIIEKLDAEKAKPETVFHTILKNTIIDHYRKNKNNFIFLTLDNEIGYDEKETTFKETVCTVNEYSDNGVMAKDVQCAIDGALSGLNKNQQAIFKLIAIKGYKYNEVAEMLNLPLNTVKVVFHRTRMSLRENKSIKALL